MSPGQQRQGHPVDVKTHQHGNWLLFLGILFTVGGVLWLVIDLGPLGGVAIFCACYLGYLGIAFRRAPTADARVALDTGGVLVSLTTGPVAIPWTAVDHWGVVQSRLAGTRQLILWPSAEPDGEVADRARTLWNRRWHGWALCRSEPAPALVTEFEQSAPRPRRDHRGPDSAVAPPR